MAQIIGPINTHFRPNRWPSSFLPSSSRLSSRTEVLNHGRTQQYSTKSQTKKPKPFAPAPSMANLTPSTNGDASPSQNPTPGSPPSPHSPSKSPDGDATPSNLARSPDATPSNQTRSPDPTLSNRIRSPDATPSNQARSPDATPSLPTIIAYRKSERKRKVREFPEMSEPKKVPGPHKTWSETDEVTLLKAAKEFRKRTGSEPKIGTIREFFDNIKGLVAPHLDPDKVYYKLRRLKSKFLLNGSVAPSGAHERVLYNLSKDVWHGLSVTEKKRASAGKKDEGKYYKDEDGYAIVAVEKTHNKVESYPFLSEALREYWKSNGDKFSAVSLENGLVQMDTARARDLEKKWKKQLEADIRTRMKRHEVLKEVYALLIDGVKGQGS